MRRTEETLIRVPKEKEDKFLYNLSYQMALRKLEDRKELLNILSLAQVNVEGFRRKLNNFLHKEGVKEMDNKEFTDKFLAYLKINKIKLAIQIAEKFNKVMMKDLRKGETYSFEKIELKGLLKKNEEMHINYKDGELYYVIFKSEEFV